MHIIELFISLYDEFKIINQEFIDAMQKYKNDKIKNNSDCSEKIINIEEENNFNENVSFDKEIKENIDKKENIKKLEKEEEKDNNYKKNLQEKNEKREDDNFIKKIYLKLLFVFHPDKNIVPSNDKFDTVTKAMQNNDIITIFYYFILYRNIIQLKSLFEELSNKKFLFKTLENYANLMRNNIIEIKKSNLWNAYYNPNLKIRLEYFQKLN